MCWSTFWLFSEQNADCFLLMLKLWLLLGQYYDYLLVKHLTICWSTIWLVVWCRSLVEVSTKLRHQCRSLVETSTRWSKFRPTCRSLVETSTKLRPNFDQPSTLRCRNLVKSEVCLVTILRMICSNLWLLFGQTSDSLRVKLLTIVGSNFWLLVGRNYDYLWVTNLTIIFQIWLFVFITPANK